MIPAAYITEWRSHAPWTQNAWVEQDLIISRALVDIFVADGLADSLAFRGEPRSTSSTSHRQPATPKTSISYRRAPNPSATRSTVFGVYSTHGSVRHDAFSKRAA